jgi:hypothetical protein
MDSTQEILDGDPQLRQLSKSGHYTHDPVNECYGDISTARDARAITTPQHRYGGEIVVARTHGLLHLRGQPNMGILPECKCAFS